MIALVLAAAVTVPAAPSSVTPPATPAAVTAAAQPATAASEMQHVEDFGRLDIEMAMVSDFSELDLAALLDANVQTASRKSEPISKAPAIIEVLTRQQIYDLGARDLYTALTFLPGVELLESYNGYTTFIIRGQLQENYNNKILLLVNGHPSFESVNSSSYLELIPLEAIERIEVIRGPGSVLYGTNAFAGVINVITATQAKDGTTTDARAQGGSFRTVSGGAGNRGRSGDLAWAVYAGGQATRGYDFTVRRSQNEDCIIGDPSGAPQCAGSVAAAFPYYNNYAGAFGDVAYKGLRLQGGAMRQDKQKYAVLPVARFHGPNEFEHYWGDLSYGKEWEKVSFTVRGGLDYSWRIWHMGRFPLPSYMETFAENNSNTYRAEAAVALTPVDQLRIDTGLGYELSTADYYDVRFTDGTLHPLSPVFDRIPGQKSASYFLQATWRLTPEVTALAGNRTTWFKTDVMTTSLDAEGFPDSAVTSEDPIVLNSPRGGLVFAPRDDLVFKALYGSAFRVPNQFETSAVFKQAIGTSPNLKPETIRTAELGIDTRPHERLSLRSNAYYSVTDRIIVRRPPTTEEVDLFGPRSSVHDNTSGQQITGVELSMKAVATKELNFFANGAYKLAKDRKTALVVGDVSRLSSSGGLSYRPVEWFVARPNAQYFGKRGAAGAYWLLNAVADFPITDNVVISAIGENLTDRTYEYPEYVRQVVETLPGGPGRAFYGRITAEF